jgi:hypothetical protein
VPSLALVYCQCKSKYSLRVITLSAWLYAQQNCQTRIACVYKPQDCYFTWRLNKFDVMFIYMLAFYMYNSFNFSIPGNFSSILINLNVGVGRSYTMYL